MAANADEVGADTIPENELETPEAEAEGQVEGEDQESEAESPSADEENVEEKTDPLEKRIGKVTANWREAERELEQQRQEASAARKALEEANKELEELRKNITPKTFADFDYDETKYQQYLTEQARSQARVEARIEAAKEISEAREKQLHETRYRNHLDLAQDFAKSTPDYFQVVSNPANSFFTDAVRDVVFESEIGPQIAYYLAKNPNEGHKIAQANPIMQGRLLGQLEYKLSQSVKATGKKSSDAPAPGSQKVKGVEPGFKVNPADPASDKMSDKEWLKRRNAQVAKQSG